METQEAVARPEASGAESEAGWRWCFHQKSPMMDSEAPEGDWHRSHRKGTPGFPGGSVVRNPPAAQETWV